MSGLSRAEISEKSHTTMTQKVIAEKDRIDAEEVRKCITDTYNKIEILKTELEIRKLNKNGKISASKTRENSMRVTQIEQFIIKQGTIILPLNFKVEATVQFRN